MQPLGRTAILCASTSVLSTVRPPHNDKAQAVALCGGQAQGQTKAIEEVETISQHDIFRDFPGNTSKALARPRAPYRIRAQLRFERSH